jgi:Ca2+-binding RTX toxin-like protein
MPIPYTKLSLSAAVASATGGYRLLPQAAGDFAPTITGVPAAAWVSGITDLNGDGIADFIIGAPGDDDKAVDAGRIFVAFGSATGGTTNALASAALPEIIIDGVTAGDLAGAAVGSVTDLNGDGKAEILVGAPGAENGALVDAGEAFVLWGLASGSIDLKDPASGGGKGYVMKGEAAGDHAGQVITSITDLTGDNKAEILIGAAGNDAGGVDAGAAYVVWGKSTNAAVNLTTVAAGTGGFRIIGQNAGDAAGQALASIGDVNGDGKADVLVGAMGNDAGGLNAGAAYVVFGKSTGTQVDLDTIAAGAGGFRITGTTGENVGSAVTGLGDINNDGIADMLVGASGSGKAYVVYGKADTSEVLLSNVAAGIGGFMITPELGSDLAKLSVTGGGDFNRDGIADIVIGTPTNSEGGANAGAVYIVWGGDGRAVDLSLISQGIGGAKIVGAAGSLTGSTVAVTPDMNGDGTPDLLIGSPGAVGESVSVVYTPTSWQPDANIYGTNGNDFMDIGYGGLHKISVGADAIYGLSGNDTIHGGDGDDSIDGGAGNDILYGDAGNDNLNGGIGNDTMTGGLGDDTFTIDSVSDVVQENAGEGTDTVIASINGYTLTAGASIENLQLAGAALSGTGNELGNTITGTTGNNTLNGGAGADTLIGLAGNDSYVVDNNGDVVQEALNAGIDAVTSSIDWTLGDNIENLTLTGTAHVGTGNSLNNSMTGTAGNDSLDGGAGNDTLAGGLGDDTYTVDSASDVVTEALNAGADTIISSVNIAVLANNVESLQLIGTALNATGNSLNNTLTGNANNNNLNGGAGADTLIGGLGDDSYTVDNLGDVAQEAAGEGSDTIITSIDNYTIGANVENLQLTGSALTGTGNSDNNSITGTAGNNTLDGAGGADTLSGGLGNDTYLVDNLGDVVQETLGQGTDTVIASMDGYTLGANAENLQLAGSARIGSGNELDNILTGSIGNDILNGAGGNDILDGGAGGDTLAGGLGNDSYSIDNMGDTVQELVGEGTDTALVSTDNWVAGANVEIIKLVGVAHIVTGNEANNIIIGGSGNDTLDGAAGNDSLDGGAGADLMIGGLGDDSFTVDNVGDVAQELAGGGIDTIITSIDNYTLAANVENLQLTGAALTGTGNGDNNTLTGNAGNNTLDGGTGADTLIGGLGNDSYLVDNMADVVQETAGEGTDTVITSIDNYTLGANVENLQLTGTAHTGNGNELDNVITGSIGDDTLNGAGGNDTLDGGVGADAMAGGAGDDSYYVDNVGDTIVEAAGEGIDSVFTSVDNWVAGANVENVRLTGGAHVVTGNAMNNSIAGTAGDDTIDGGDGDDLEVGGDGNDVLISGSGLDTLAGGSGDDRYVLKGGQAYIEDFLGHDTIDASETTGDSNINLDNGLLHVQGQDSHVGTGGSTSSPLDVQFLQDLTGSFADDIIYVRNVVPQIISALQAVQTNSEFGVSTFRDKPIGSFGGVGDWVYQQQLALTTNAGTLANAYASMIANNGADGPEAQIEALMQLALHSADVGFRPDSAHFVVLFTDAPFHNAGDGAAIGLIPNNGNNIMEGGGIIEDYPMVSQLQSALAAANIIPIFAIAGGYESTYQGLVTALGRGTVVTLTANSSNVVAAITGGLTAATTTQIEDAVGGAGNDTLTGNLLNNALSGNAGNDHINGGAGADTIRGDAGDDVLTGGAGNDTFVFSVGDGHDEITDDSLGNTSTDVVQFANVASTDITFSRPIATDSLLVTDGSGDTVTVDGFFGANPTGSIAQFQFSNAVTLTQADVVALVNSGNTAPTLTGTPAVLANGTEDTTQIISAVDLLQGYTDAESNPLTATNLTANHGTLADNLNGTWTFTPAANYNGAVILNYNVEDGHSGVTPASQSFNLAAVNDAPALTGAAATLAAGVEDAAYTLNATDLLAGFTDVEGDTLSVANLAATNGTLADNLNGSWTFTPAANYNGAVALSYNVIDGNGGITAASQSFNLAAVNDAPALTGAVATLAAGVEDAAYTLNATDLLAGFTDVEGDTLSVANLAATNGTLVDNLNGTWMFTPSAYFNGAVALSYNVIDGNGGITAASQSFNIANTNYAPVITSSTVNPATATTTTANYTGALSFTDLDTIDTHTSAPVSANGLAGGALATRVTEVAGSGAVDWTYAYTVPAAFGTTVQTKTDSFNISVNDGNGGVATQNIAINVATGTAAANTLNGTTGLDILLGGGGGDTLNGVSGQDLLFGGLGNDIYVINGGGSVIFENVGEGTDIVKSAIDYTLGANIENLTLTGTGNLNGGGNELANTINGNVGDNILTGGYGKDILKGNGGNDTFVVNVTALGTLEDTVTAGIGIDTLKAGGGNYTGLVAKTLTAAATIENYDLSDTGTSLLNVSGNALANSLTGNDANNTLKGLAGNDLLDGGAGNDIVVGGLGNDTLAGGAGADKFWFDSLLGAANVDSIIDFTSGSDMLQFSKAAVGLTAIGAIGHFSATDARFEANATGVASTAAGRLLYNTASGELLYDGDGNGAAAPVVLEVLASAPAVVASDIWVV